MDKIRATFTLAGLRAHHACTGGYAKLRASLPADFPEDQPIPLLKALESNPVQDVIWALRTVGQDIRAVLPLLAADFAGSVPRAAAAYAAADAYDAARAAERTKQGYVLRKYFTL